MNRRNTATAQPDRRDRLIASIATVSVHAMLLAVLLTAVLRHQPEDDTEPLTPAEEETEITFEDVVDFKVGGSYTIPQEIIEPVPEPELSQGSQTSAAPLPQPDPQEIEQQKRDEIARRVKFATNNIEETTGDSGDANSTTAAPPDVNTEVIGLDGFSAEGFPRPGGFSETGTIAIAVTVDANGNVIVTNYNPSRSYGKISNNQQAIRECQRVARMSKFKPRPGTESGTTGIIYYHFKK